MPSGWGRDERRSVRLLWTSQLVSQLGAGVASLAAPLLVLELSESVLLASVLAGASGATSLVARLPGGVIADRYTPRTIMLVADVVRLSLLAAIAVMVWLDLASPGLVIGVVVAEVACGAVFGPAEFSLLRSVVTREHRAGAVARMESRAQVAGLVAPLVGGGLFAVDPALPFAVDAASYLVSFVLVALIRAPGRTRPARREHWREEVRAGWLWLRQDRFLRSAMFWVAALTATFAAVGLALLVIARERGASPVEIGALFTISAVGGLAGALATPALVQRLHPVVLLRTAVVVDVVATLAVLGLTSPYAIGAVGAAAFLLVPSVNAVLLGEVARRCPDDVVGRAQATVGTALAVAAPVAPVLVGLVMEEAGPAAGIAGCAAAFFVLAVAAFTLPGFRLPDRQSG